MKFKKVLIPLAAMSLVGAMSLTSCKSGSGDKDKTTQNADTTKEYAPNELSVNDFNATTTFNLGEKFNADGLKVTLVFSNYSTKVLDASEYKVDSSSFDSSKVGTYDIHVIYTSEKNVRVTNTYQVTVKSIAEEATPHVLGIEASINKTDYKVSEVFSSEGLKVTANYSDGTTKDVTSQVSVDDSLIDMKKMGVYQFKVSYSEKYTKDSKEETKECKTFVLVTVDALLSKLEFKSGTTTLEQDTVGPDGTMTSLDISDWVVDGTFQDLNYDALHANIDISKATISGFNSGISGEQTVTITYTHSAVTQSCTTTVYVTPIATPDYVFNAGSLPQANNTTIGVETVFDDIISMGPKCQVKDDDKTFGNMSFTKRVQTNGMGKAGESNYIKFTLEKDATVAMIARSSGASKPVTAAGFYDANGALVSTSFAYSTDISKYKYELKAGTYYFYDVQYAVQIYGIQIWYK